jgi:hypothetical protein
MWVYMNRNTANGTPKHMIYAPKSLLLHSISEIASCLVRHVGACESDRGVKMATHSPQQTVKVRIDGFPTIAMYSTILPYCCISDYTLLNEKLVENNGLEKI